jgi:hypothetical protein
MEMNMTYIKRISRRITETLTNMEEIEKSWL